ncbi:MAG: SGNH/GDSL hydrolase family protein [Planctomycetota bacterium]
MRKLLALLVIVSCGLGIECREAMAALVVFGDSLSDSGNLYRRFGAHLDPATWPFNPANPISPLPAPPYDPGRASNGPVWIEHLSQRLGYGPLMPSLAGGTNHAQIMSLVREDPGAGIVSLLQSPDLDTQVAGYLASHVPAADDLFVLWGGANDFFSGQSDPLVPVAALAEQITALKQAGAAKFVIPNLPMLGLTPSGAVEDTESLNQLSTAFNAALASTIADLRTDLGVTIHELDVNGFFQQALADPAAFGLTNVEDPALAVNLDPESLLFGFPLYPLSVVSNPDEYLYWDSLHPTAAAHEMLADWAYAQIVPEPAAMALLAVWCAIGAAAISLSSRRGAA